MGEIFDASTRSRGLNPTRIARQNPGDTCATIRDIRPETFWFDDAFPALQYTAPVHRVDCIRLRSNRNPLPEKRSVLIRLSLDPG
jgi:hypothetical protein